MLAGNLLLRSTSSARRHMGHLGLHDLGTVMANGQGYAAGLSKPRVDMIEIPGGYAGTVATIDHMRKAVLGTEGAHHPEVRFIAQKIVEKLPSKDYARSAAAIDAFMRRHVRYTLDPRGLEWVQTPFMTLLTVGQGDCDDHAVATVALAASLGLGGKFRTVKGDPKGRPNEFTHVYALIGIRKGGKEYWFPADSTELNAKFGQDPPGAHKYEKKDWPVVPA